MNINKNKLLLTLITVLILVSCEAESSRPYFVTSSYPLTLILQEIIGTKGRVETLVPMGASPHTYTPKPTDIQKATSAKAFLFVDMNYDGWSKNLNAKSSIEVFKLMPAPFIQNFTEPYLGGDSHNHSPNDGHNHEAGSPDPHFWMDPIAVKALLPALVDTLGKIDPDNANLYKTNADIFAKKIDILSRQVEDLTKNLRGKQVFLYHPSILYMLKRYDMIYAGSIELLMQTSRLVLHVSAFKRYLKLTQGVYFLYISYKLANILIIPSFNQGSPHGG